MPRSSHPPAAESGLLVTSELEIEDQNALVALAGPRNERLRIMEAESGVTIGVRGHRILLRGTAESVATVERFLAEAAMLHRKGRELASEDVVRAMRLLRDEASYRLRDVYEDGISLGAGRKAVALKGLSQRLYVDAIRKNDLTFGLGPAGTGKTYLAVACAVGALQQKLVKRIILTRPAVEAGERLGFLPGDLAEKVNPYLRPLFDAMGDMMDADVTQGLMARGQLEVAPLAFMRGRTLNDAFVILDEAQNTTCEQMRMFLTRLGYNSKAVVTGDLTQIDLPSGRLSGLAEAHELLKEVEGIAFCTFADTDVVRHPLVQKIIVAYEAKDRRKKKEDMSPRNA
jgi:phosphate starvation-inducible PhoH-like protein